MKKEDLIIEGERIKSLIHPIVIPLWGEKPLENGVEECDLEAVKKWIENLRLYSINLNNDKISKELSKLWILDQHNRVSKERIQFALDLLKIS